MRLPSPAGATMRPLVGPLSHGTLQTPLGSAALPAPSILQRCRAATAGAFTGPGDLGRSRLSTPCRRSPPPPAPCTLASPAAAECRLQISSPFQYFCMRCRRWAAVAAAQLWRSKGRDAEQRAARQHQLPRVCRSVCNRPPKWPCRSWWECSWWCERQQRPKRQPRRKRYQRPEWKPGGQRQQLAFWRGRQRVPPSQRRLPCSSTRAQWQQQQQQR